MCWPFRGNDNSFLWVTELGKPNCECNWGRLSWWISWSFLSCSSLLELLLGSLKQKTVSHSDNKASKDKARNKVPVMFLSSLPRSLLDKHRTISKQGRERREESTVIIWSSQPPFLLYPQIRSSYSARFWGHYEALLSSNPSLALINSGRRLLTALVASQGGHAKHPLQVLQLSPTAMSRGSPSTSASHSPQCWEMMGFAVGQQLRNKEPGNKTEEEKQRETNGQSRKEAYGKQKRYQSHLIHFN